MSKLLFFSFLFILNIGFTQKKTEFDEVDNYARLAPKNSQTIDDLVSYFSQKSYTDIEKARLIYVWLAENISYDDRAYNLKNIGDNTAKTVFKTKKAVCAGFANLYTELGEKLGLEIITVSGVAKGYEYEEDLVDNLEESVNHAWNLIRINNEWRVFDATWGEGFGASNKKGKLVSTKEFNDDWFNIEPSQAIFTHLPEDVSKQYISAPINFQTFLALPWLTPREFKTEWLTPEEILLKLNEKKRVDLPVYYNFFNDLKLIAPKERILKKGKPHEFSLKSKEIRGVFIYLNEEEVIPFSKDGEYFKYIINAKNPGSYHVVVSNKNNELYTLLEYLIE